MWTPDTEPFRLDTQALNVVTLPASERTGLNALTKMNINRSLVLVSFLVVGSVVAADWPQYRGSHSDGSSAEKISKNWPEAGLKPVWKVALTDGFSSFSSGAGKVFTLVSRPFDGVKRETVLALDAASGKELWTHVLGVSKFQGGGDSGTPENSGGDGPRVTPAFADGKVYALSAGLSLVALDAATGKPAWSKNLVEDHGAKNISWQNAASPVIDGDLVFVACGGEGQSLLGIHRTTGKVVWKGESDAITHATPVVATLHGQRQVIFFTQSGLVACNTSDGKPLWRYKFPFSTSTAASPVVSGDIVYCSAGYGVGSGAVQVAKGADGWTATELWRTPGNEICNHWSTPVVSDGYLYGMFSFKKYGSGPVKCIEIATGKEKWSQAGFGAGNMILVDGHLLALGDAGQLVLLKADPAGYRELARTRALAGKCWSTPIVSNGRIFVRSTKEGAAFDVAPAVTLK